jgi:hypothetical protein
MLGQQLAAQPGEGPLGLRWGMSPEAWQSQNRLCCRQVGEWGARYEVDSQDFDKFPNPLGDEEKVYVYFGNTNKLLRIFISIKKTDGWNRYKQINSMIESKYDMKESCVHKVLDKYEALRRGTSEQTCKEYEAYSSYNKDDVEVFVGLKQMGVNYEVSITQLHNGLYVTDKKKKSPL